MGLFNTASALVSNNSQWEATPELSAADGAAAVPVNRSVLIIDDDQQFLDGISPAIRAAGFTVLTSTSGPKGLNLLRYAPHDFCALLLDYNMPGFDGDQTLNHARKLMPSIKVIGITGLQPAELSATYRDGVDELVLKPFSNSELIALLHVLVNGDPATAPPPAS